MIVIVLLFLLLRKLSEVAVQYELPPWGTYLGGILSWAFVLSLLGYSVLTGYLIYDLLANKNLVAIYVLMFIGIIGGMLFQGKEVLDSARVGDYVRTALRFEPYTLNRFRLDDELEKKRVKDVYRQITGKEAREIVDTPRLKTEAERRRLQREAAVLTSRQQQITSPTLKDEVQQLRAGHVVDLSDVWKINSFKRSTHEWYGNVSSLQIDPQTHRATFRVNLPEITRMQLVQTNTLFSFKQDLYAFLQAVSSEEWLKPYASFVDQLDVTCFGLETDGFGQTALYPFFHILIGVSELAARAGKFFAVTELHTISRITFNNGDPIA